MIPYSPAAYFIQTEGDSITAGTTSIMVASSGGTLVLYEGDWPVDESDADEEEGVAYEVAEEHYAALRLVFRVSNGRLGKLSRVHIRPRWVVRGRATFT